MKPTEFGTWDNQPRVPHTKSISFPSVKLGGGGGGGRYIHIYNIYTYTYKIKQKIKSQTTCAHYHPNREIYHKGSHFPSHLHRTHLKRPTIDLNEVAAFQSQKHIHTHTHTERERERERER